MCRHLPIRLRQTLSILITAMAALLAALPSGMPAHANPRPVTPRGELGAEEKATIDLFERAKGSVVYISTHENVMDLWTRNVFSVPKGTGSGFVWDEDGHVITNLHVVQNANEARVKLADGRSYKATLVGASPSHDIAVLRIAIDGKKPAPLPIGESAKLKPGQRVYAIGNPFGLDWTLTTGIISAMDRSLPADNGRQIDHLIQTDAAINPGNSGGPLLDSAGRLIGINTAIYSPSGASAGIGFAVPVDTVNRVVPQLIKSGAYVRPTLGVGVDEAVNRRLNDLTGKKGVFVLKISKGSGAEKAGLRPALLNRDGSVTPGDIIVAIEGTPIDTVAKLFSRLDDFAVGSKVRVTVLRGDARSELTVTLDGQR